MEEFDCRVKIVSGAGAVSKLADFGARRLFVVTDPFFYKNGMAQQVATASKAESVEFFHDVRPDPTVELAAEGTAKLKAFGADLIVALGGGSAMDCAKAMAFFAKEDTQLVAIPTTSGSGSEVTDFAVLTVNDTKHPLVDPALQPELAILDSNLLTTLPRTLIADSGYDILAHAVESYVATGAGTVSRALAAEAVSVAGRLLPASFSGDTTVRQQIHLAATMAGVAFSQSGLGLCHAIAHALGGRFHLPHGRLNAILLPAVVEANAAANPHYAALSRAAGLGGTADAMAVRNLRNALCALRKQLQLPQTLAQAGVSPRDVAGAEQALIAAALSDPCCSTNPVRPDGAMVQRVLQQVTGNG